MSNRLNPLEAEKGKSAYVYSGFCCRNNYIQCYDGRIKAPSHYPQWRGMKQERNQEARCGM